jgi:hypothetical protein
VSRFFAWLSEQLGITDARKQSEWQFRQLEEKLAEIKLQTIPKISIPPGNKKIAAVRQAPTIHDYESSQRAVLDEFKEQ